MDAVHKKVDGVEIVLRPTYPEDAELLLVEATTLSYENMRRRQR
jgi:hypothetical protein